MGHSVHPIGFRLSHIKNWNHLLPPHSPLLNLVALQSESLLLRRLANFGLLLNSSAVRSTPFGSLQVRAAIYSSSSVRLQQFIYRKADRQILHPLLSLRTPVKPYPHSTPCAYSVSAAWSVANPALRLLDLLSRLLLPSFSALLSHSSIGSLRICATAPSQLSGQLLAKLLSVRLRTGAPLPKFANRFLSQLFDRFSKSMLLGLFVGARGRFTRSQMATATSFRRGRTPFSSVAATLSYSTVSVPLKYGVCTLSFAIVFKSNYVPYIPLKQRRPKAYSVKVSRNRF